MTQQRQIPDHRESFRCTVADSRQRCELRVGADVLSATLLDESVGGFAVLVDRLAGLDAGQTAELCTDAGTFVVRVMHVAEVEPPEHEMTPPENDEAAADKPTPWFRLGLSRLNETALPEQPAVSRWATELRFRMSQWYSSRGMPMAVSALLAAVVVAVPLGLVIAIRYFGQGGTKQSVQSSPSVWSGRLPHIKTPLVRPASEPQGYRSDFANAKSAAESFSGHAQPSARMPAMPRQQFQELVRRLPGVTALTLPQMVKKLQLTKVQQEQIHRMLDSAAQTIRDLEKELPGQERRGISQFREHLLDEALRESLTVLTDQQRAEWEKLTGAPPPPPQGH